MAEEDRHAARAKQASRTSAALRATNASVVVTLNEVKAHITAGTEDEDAQTKLDAAIAALS